MDGSDWKKIVQNVQNVNSTLYGILRIAETSYKDGCIEMRFKFLFHQKQMADKSKLIVVAKEASKVLESNVHIKVINNDSVLVSEAKYTYENHSSEIDSDRVQFIETLQKKATQKEKIYPERIYLKHVHISNFRAITEANIELNPKVNIIIGANNIGKSAIVDAIRLALQVGRYRKSKFVTPEDFNDTNEEIEIDLKFSCPDRIKGLPELKTFELDSSGKRIAHLELHVRYFLTGTGENRQVRQRFWGGNTGGKVPDEEALDIFSFEYLGALRDANFVLKPSTKSKIADLLLNLRANKIDRKKVEEVFENAQKHPEIKKLVSEANTSVQSHLSKIALKNDEFNVSFQPLPPIFEDLVGGFDVKLLTAVLTSTVSQNGLGYNNILYTSTVLGHIKSAQIQDPNKYHALLIEEPEAHLHPQLEDSLFSYLSNLGGKIGSQIIVTSHSPIISSTTNVNNLIIIHKYNEITSTTNLSKITLESAEKRKISRYMDVTKSQLFFATSVLLVEGITESLLLPKLADGFFKEENSLLSRGIEVVNIDGVSFEPYAKLFNQKKVALPMRAAILTDRDSYKDKTGAFHEMSARSKKALTFKEHNLDVCITKGRTFEYDLWESGNEEIMKQAAKKLFNKTNFNNAEDILKAMDKSSVYGKGDLAQEILEIDTPLSVPDYIQKALKWITGNGTN